ncbi:DUF1778 domain-containing protein [Candidatus Tisiphia endosymbiont of Dioctria rufipes]|uniref:type II toxin-antitoxin system TacA family antitoxin n=1 Tax=Candidatus Tisiphia endosymbiont of Dioctria rufipes TaxID=3066255 RepID=UPI00312C84E5
MAKNNSKTVKQEYVRLEARIAPELKQLFIKAAEIQGTNLTNFIVSSSKREAESIIKEHVLINLTLKDMTLFAQAVINNIEPNDKLKTAAGKFKLSYTS